MNKRIQALAAMSTIAAMGLLSVPSHNSPRPVNATVRDSGRWDRERLRADRKAQRQAKRRGRS